MEDASTFRRGGGVVSELMDELELEVLAVLFSLSSEDELLSCLTAERLYRLPVAGLVREMTGIVSVCCPVVGRRGAEVEDAVDGGRGIPSAVVSV